MELETRYSGIIKKELITEEMLKQIAMAPFDAPKDINTLRTSTTGYCLLQSRNPIVGVLIIDPVVELSKPEWNPIEDEFSSIVVWYKPSTWPIFN